MPECPFSTGLGRSVAPHEFGFSILEISNGERIDGAAKLCDRDTPVCAALDRRPVGRTRLHRATWCFAAYNDAPWPSTIAP